MKSDPHANDAEGAARRKSPPREPVAAKRPLIIVLGMHRSGTSAITRGLSAIGVELGENLMAPVAGNNEKGFFEDMDLYRFNERLLSKLGSAWHRLSPLDTAALAGRAFSAERREATSLLASKAANRIFAFKDPRTAVLLPFWQCVTEDLNLDDCYVIAVRNPLEVAASLEARDGFPLTKSALLWTKHMLEAVRNTQGRRRVFARFDRVLEDPLRELTRIALTLGLPEPDPASEAIKEYQEEFLDPTLRHNLIGEKELLRSGVAPSFAIDLYDLICSLAANSSDAKLDVRKLHAIEARYEDYIPALFHIDRVDEERAAALKRAAAAEARFDESEKTRAATSREAAAAYTALTEKLAAAEKLLADRAEETRALSDKRQEVETALAELKSALTFEQEAKQDIEAKWRELEFSSAKSMRSLTEKLQELEQQLTSEQTERAELEALLRAAEETLVQIKKREADAMDHIANLTAERNDLVANLSELNASLQQEKAARNQIGFRLQRLSEWLNPLESAVAKNEEHKVSADVALQSLLDERDKLAADVSALKAATEAEQTARAHAEFALQEVESQLEQAQRDLNELEAQRGAAELNWSAEKEQTQRALKNAQRDRDHVAADLEALKAEHAAEAAERARLEERLQDAALENAEMIRIFTAELKDFAGALEAVSKAAQKSQSEVDGAQTLTAEDTAAARNQIHEATALVEALQAEIETLRARTAEESDKARADLAAARAEAQSTASASVTQANARADAAEAALRHLQAQSRERTQTDSVRIQALDAELSNTRRNAREQQRKAQDQIEKLTEKNALLQGQFRDVRRDMLLARAALTKMRTSASWRLTAPLRVLVNFARNPIHETRTKGARLARAAWRRIPLSPTQRGKIAHKLFSTAPVLFSWTGVYKVWSNRQPNGQKKAVAGDDSPDPPPDPALEGCVPLIAAEPPRTTRARAIAFYLPQFHAIPENDEWWGEGFTEWTKVRAARPCFEGHDQPQRPADLGYYNLLDEPNIMERQAALAKLHGVEGFCFYYYWFGGKRLLEAPLQRLLQSPQIGLPYCLCWANENWTRTWDGKDRDVLVAQRHSPEDDLAFIKHVSQYFQDSRYIRIDGRPLLVVYRPSLLPEPKRTTTRWRNWLRQNGFGEIYLAYTQSFEATSPEIYGFDAAIEFPPNNTHLLPNRNLAPSLDASSKVSVYDWRILARRSHRYAKPSYKLFRGVNPSWDNTPRRPKDGAVFVGATPSAYRSWLSNAVEDTRKRFPRPEERLIFINAWNEWAEGAHLEPDQTRGYAWLEATRRALDANFGERKIIVVTHDLQRHGAQYLALNLVRTLRKQFGITIATISGASGPLAKEFQREGRLIVLDRHANQRAAIEAIEKLKADGYQHAIANSSASGWIAPALASHGIEFISLIHELPSIIDRMGLAENLRKLNEHAKALIFPTKGVRDADAAALAMPSWRNAFVLPQGLYKSDTASTPESKSAARRRILAQLRLPPETEYVLGVGHGDERKGLDIFVNWATACIKRWPHLHFIWLGEIAPDFREAQRRALEHSGDARNAIHFPGFVENTRDYFLGAKFYALSSREDPFPSTVLEALAGGTPAIAVKGKTGAEEIAAMHIAATDSAAKDSAAKDSAAKDSAAKDSAKDKCVKVIKDASATAFLQAAGEWMNDSNALSRAGELGRDLVRQNHGFATYVAALTDHLGLDLPDISVVVPNFNYARHLEQRLSSILQQTLAPREIIVLDDASTDESIAVAERMLGQSPINWKIVRNDRNSGSVFKQWRRGVELAKGEFVWIAEADDWADARFLETAVQPFARGDVAMSVTQSKQASESGAIIAPDYLDYLRDIAPDSSTGKWARAYIADGLEEVRNAFSIKNAVPNVSAAVFRRAALLETLTASERDIAPYRVAGDWCVYVNVLRRGAFAFTPAALNYHRRHDSSVTIAKFALSDLVEIARMQSYVAREFGLGSEHAARARAYLERLAADFNLERRWSRAQIEGAMRGVLAA